jgi:hypothetical protein
MPTWASLAVNELVDRNAIADAVANQILFYAPGQSCSGSQCVTVSDAETILSLDTSFMPTNGSMPVKSDFVNQQTEVNIYNNHQTSPVFVPCVTFFGINGVNQDTLVGSQTATHLVRGGNGINVVLNMQGASPGSGALAPSLRVQVYRNGVLIYDQAQDVNAGNFNWGTICEPNVIYDIYCFSQSYSGPFYIWNGCGYDITLYVYATGTSYTISNGGGLDVTSLLGFNSNDTFDLYPTVDGNYEVDGSAGSVISTETGLSAPIEAMWSGFLPYTIEQLIIAGNSSVTAYKF